jgi:Fe-S cluster assembly ATPase SufC
LILFYQKVQATGLTIFFVELVFNKVECALWMQVLVGHPDYEVTGGTAIFKGENLFDKEPEERSHCGLFLSFQSPVEIPGVSNMDFLRMACNARRKARNLEELGPLEVTSH